VTLYIGSWHKADIVRHLIYVCFVPKADGNSQLRWWFGNGLASVAFFAAKFEKKIL
jgi:hypothetical protein